ncbi:MAG: hypothetical protein AAFX54_00010 [Pseudomonadota bacterium]
MKTRCRQTDPRAVAQHGGAIIVVLWTSILLSMLLVGALATVRGEARSARARADSLKADASARSGLDLAAWRLATGEVQTIDELADMPITLNGYEVSVAPSLDSRKIDINLADERTLAVLFEFLGEEPASAQKLAARIADWRDRDDLVRPNGAERSDYAAARNGEAIGNRYFHGVAELKTVLGFPSELYDCVRPALTIMGDDGAGDPLLFQTIYGAAPFANNETPGVRLSTSGRAARAGSRVSVTVTADGPNGRKKSITGLFRVIGGRQQPFEYIAVYTALERPLTPAPDECRQEQSDNNG